MHGCMYVNLRKCIHTGVDMSPVRGLRHPGTACAAPPDPPRAVSIPVRALVGECVCVCVYSCIYIYISIDIYIYIYLFNSCACVGG